MLILFSLLVVLMIIGLPVAYAIGIASAAYMLTSDMPILALAQRMSSGTDSYILLAIPFFMLAGELMNKGGLTTRLVNFAESIIGRVRGGLSYVVILVNMIMAGVSGSAAADAAAVGSVMIPAMEKNGYSRSFSAAVNAAAATVGPIIPPSIGFIVYASITNVSVGKLFLAGALPGLIMGLYFAIVCFIIARKRKLPFGNPTSFKRIASSLKDSYLSILMPVVILGGIVGGIVTPTEASVVAVVYGLIVGMFVYKEITWSDLPILLAKAAKSASIIMFIVACASTFGWVLTFTGAPEKMLALLNIVADKPWVFLLIINIIVLILGCFMEGTAIKLILVPLILPILKRYNIDLVHFGVVIMLNCMIGLLTPPVGMNLFVISGVAKISIPALVKELWPFMIALFIALIMVTYIPEISMFLPNMLMK